MTFPSKPNRRQLLRFSALSGAGIMFGYGEARADGECISSEVARAPRPEAAVSLKRLAAKLVECGDPNDRQGQKHTSARQAACDSSALLGGLTRLDGFVVDSAQQDIVLWGASESGKPPLRTDDFVIALRVANGLYTVKEGGKTVLYEPPSRSTPIQRCFSA